MVPEFFWMSKSFSSSPPERSRDRGGGKKIGFLMSGVDGTVYGGYGSGCVQLSGVISQIIC